MNPNEVENRLREIAERENKATNGPWKNSNYRPGQIIQRDPSESTYELGDDKFAPILWVSGSPFQQHEDQNFIAHSRQDVPWLLALIKKQREALEHIVKFGEFQCEQMCAEDYIPRGRHAPECPIEYIETARDALKFSPE